VKTEEAKSSETLVFYCNTTWHQKPEDLDVKLPKMFEMKTKSTV